MCIFNQLNVESFIFSQIWFKYDNEFRSWCCDLDKNEYFRYIYMTFQNEYLFMKFFINKLCCNELHLWNVELNILEQGRMCSICNQKMFFQILCLLFYCLCYMSKFSADIIGVYVFAISLISCMIFFLTKFLKDFCVFRETTELSIIERLIFINSEITKSVNF